MKRIFSGIQPTGELHIGNYFGAIKNWVTLTKEYECFYCIVDYHAITIEYDIKMMQDRILNAAIDLVACGLTPENCTLFVQSDVPQHTELCWILNSVTQMGELMRMTQFKEKSSRNQKNINAGLFDYPVLQAADILIYHAGYVPVGEDQIQHVELTRTIARAFNNRFGEYFPEPVSLISKTPKILGLDGKSKMSKSYGNVISIREPEDVIKRKILREAVTDEKRQKLTDKGTPEVCNLRTIHSAVTAMDQLTDIEIKCREAKIGCVECKKILFENLMKEIRPIQEKIKDLSENKSRIYSILDSNRDKCIAICDKTLSEVKKLLGLKR